MPKSTLSVNKESHNKSEVNLLSKTGFFYKPTPNNISGCLDVQNLEKAIDALESSIYDLAKASVNN